MRIGVPRERRPNETRVAASPETVKKIKAMGFDVVIETGAGLGAGITDKVFSDAGAEIVADAAAALGAADIVLKVQRPSTVAEGGPDELALIKRGAVLIGMLNPWDSRDLVEAYAAAGVDALNMEFMPRVTRAQVMDVLSSQANLAGYKAVVDAASEYSRAFPMMMTAAGTVPPAKAFIMGVGVAGLQAIATAKRLGAVVSATDVRPAVKEQVQSLGGSFVAIENEEFKQAETAGGYAKEMSADYKRLQAELVAEHIKKQDVVVTTALIPGRKAPILVTKEHVASMKPGAVIVDLAVDRGGNVEGVVPGEVVVTDNGVKLIGHLNYASRIASDASPLYARNLLALLAAFLDKDAATVVFNPEDEIVKAITLTRAGAVVHPAFAAKA